MAPYIKPGVIENKFGSEARMRLHNENRRRHSFPWSLSSGNNGATVETLHCKRKTTPLMEEAKDCVFNCSDNSNTTVKH